MPRAKHGAVKANSVYVFFSIYAYRAFFALGYQKVIGVCGFSDFLHDGLDVSEPVLGCQPYLRLIKADEMRSIVLGNQVIPRVRAIELSVNRKDLG
jgi:hypothetical protein